MPTPEFDERSEKNLATLRPKAQPHFRALLRALKAYAASKGLDAKILSANRTWEEQDALYAKGRTTPPIGKKYIVTNARGGQSNHNYQIAVDIGLFKDGKYLDELPEYKDKKEPPQYKEMGPLGEKIGLEWGGSWVSITDRPHYQIKVGKTVAELRELVRTHGWDALDALIPTYTPPAPPTPAPTPKPPTLAPKPAPAPAPVPEKITVLLDRGEEVKTLSLDAWFIESRVWVAVRDWTDYFGGTLVEKEGKYKLVLNGESTPIATQLLHERAAAKFADINAVLGWNFSFDGAARPRKLTIHPDA